jgi:hypothetical protein
MRNAYRDKIRAEVDYGGQSGWIDGPKLQLVLVDRQVENLLTSLSNGTQRFEIFCPFLFWG